MYSKLVGSTHIPTLTQHGHVSVDKPGWIMGESSELFPFLFIYFFFLKICFDWVPREKEREGAGEADEWEVSATENKAQSQTLKSYTVLILFPT